MAVSTGNIMYGHRDGAVVIPQSLEGKWVTAVSDAKTADNGGSRVTTPATQVTAASRYLLTVGAGTYCILRLKYTGLPSTDAVVQVFGKDKDGNYTILRTIGASPVDEITLAKATGDLVVGSNTYTGISNDVTVDLLGSSQILVGVKTASNATTAAVEVRVI